MAAAEHAFFAILYDIPKECYAPSFLRLAHVGVDTLEKAAELVADTDSDQAAIYRAGNAVIAECRAVRTSASGTDLLARLRSEGER
jgi:hypothetical protein